MNNKPTCPKCGASEIVKNGKARGKQRFKCKNCNFQFTILVPRGYPPETKARVIDLYNHGLSIRAAAKLQNVSRTSALNWIREFAKKNIWKACSRWGYPRWTWRNVALPGLEEKQIMDMESVQAWNRLTHWLGVRESWQGDSHETGRTLIELESWVILRG